jgi:hypothetical protein
MMAVVFFSYSHKDESLRDQLESHLALLKNQGLIEAWYDRRILAGSEVDNSILGKLETADIILLLVSSDFISSPYCYSREMTRAMERHDAGEARVIPVILRHCDWHTAPFGKLMALPRDGKPVTSWTDMDEAFTDVTRQVRRAAEAADAKAQVSSSGGTSGARARPQLSTTEGSQMKPRSGNLRLKKEYTEKDRDEFLRETFEFISRFFGGSIEAIDERNPDVTGNFDKIDSRRMAAVLYRNGKKIAECSVRLEGLGGRSNGIAFSHDSSATPGSYNEMLSVEVSDQSLYLRAMGMGWSGRDRDQHLSQEGAAEFLWDLFIRSAQE